MTNRLRDTLSSGGTPMMTGLSLLRRLNRALERVVELALLVLLAGFLSLILYQVVSRSLPVLPPLHWTEEFSRFAFQWMVMLGAALGVYRSDHFVLEAFPPASRIGRATRMLREFVLAGIALFLVIEGWAFAETGWQRHSTAAQMPMFWVYVTFFACGALMLCFLAHRILLLLTRGLESMEAELNTPLPEEAPETGPRGDGGA